MGMRSVEEKKQHLCVLCVCVCVCGGGGGALRVLCGSISTPSGVV